MQTGKTFAIHTMFDEGSIRSFSSLRPYSWYTILYTRLDGKGQECSTHATVPENGYVFLYFAAVHITFK